MTGTRHTCGGPVFGRKMPGCPRCDQLAAGAPARTQPWRRRESAKQADARMRAEIQVHFASARHRYPDAPGGCGPCCTFGEW